MSLLNVNDRFLLSECKYCLEQQDIRKTSVHFHQVFLVRNESFLLTTYVISNVLFLIPASRSRTAPGSHR